ncbi:hypothetical protein B0H15DRAFT_849619, partial [Mycena belliarum]
QDWTWSEEVYRGARLIPISETCRYLREQAMPSIYREVYNWSRANGNVWPTTLWPFIVTATLRQHSIRYPKPIIVSNDMFGALPMMPSLTKVVLRMDTSIPPGMLEALSLVPHLRILDIQRALLDGPPFHLTHSSFASLETLIICVWKITDITTISAREVNKQSEYRNVVELLHSVKGILTTLTISGDLLSPHFLSLKWPHLLKFVVTEHTPTPYLSVPDLTSHMPALRELSVLFSADLTRTSTELRPPFTLGTLDGRPLSDASPHLHTVVLSNIQPDDFIFAQLPRGLDALHIRATGDIYIPQASLQTTSLGEAPLTSLTVFTVIQHVSCLTELTQLSLMLDHFPTATIIEAIAKACPALRFLELEALGYNRGNVPTDVRDSALIAPLVQLTHLAHLRVSLDFYTSGPPDRWIPELPMFQRSPHESAARWFFFHHPTLQSVAFPWQLWTAWKSCLPLEKTVWATYERRFVSLARPLTPPIVYDDSESDNGIEPEPIPFDT